MKKHDQKVYFLGVCLYIFFRLSAMHDIHTLSLSYEDHDYFVADEEGGPMKMSRHSSSEGDDPYSNLRSQIEIFEPKKSEARAGRPDMEIAIFWNIYVHPEPGRDKYVKTAKRIIQEQLKYRREEPELVNATIYYSHFGKQDFEIQDCSPCKRIAGGEHGNEQITLQKLYEYCTVNPQDRVLYMHTKGSYTRCRKNHLLRNFLMKGIFSPECYDMPTNGTCDVCTSHFSTFPFHSVAGNMFVAECDYVRKLIPPDDFSTAKAAVMEKVWNVTDRLKDEELKADKYGKALFRTIYHLKSRERKQMRKGRRDWQIHREPWVGVGRYSMEHWIHSHPSVRPCDVFDEEFQYKHKGDVIIKNGANRVNAPRSMNLTDMNYGNHAWYRLQGRLFEYQQIYSSLPSPDSWIYKAYNDTLADTRREFRRVAKEHYQT